MRYIKKIDSIPLVDGGKVVDSFETTDNPHKNAPSIHAVEEKYGDLSGIIDIIRQEMDNVWDKIYPVGSIYYTTNDANPSVLFGGVWEAYAVGRVVVGYDPYQEHFNVVGKKDGSYTTPYTPSGTVNGHSLTVNELPDHVHWVRETPLNATFGSGSQSEFLMKADGGSEYYTKGIRGSSGLGQAHGHTFTGRQSSISVLQPYQVVKIWRRTA